MASRTRICAALALLTVLGGGVVGQLGVHAHAFGEVDLVAHSLVAIDHPPAALAAAHFDLATELRHPVCGDCLLASQRSDIAAGPPPSLGLTVALAAVAPLASSAPRGRFVRRAPARAPPAA